VSVPRRNRSICTPTRPTTHEQSPLELTVSNRIGSLKNGPLKIWPGRKDAGALMVIATERRNTTGVRNRVLVN
jgi:hypothetical protein